MTTAPEPLPRWPDAAALRCAGRATPRASGEAKVRGQAVYASDVVLPGLVHAALIRSTVAHGEVTAFDAGAARATAGVLAVIGPLDTPALPGMPLRSSDLRLTALIRAT